MYTMNLAHSAHCVTPYEVAAGASPDNTHIRKGTPEGAEIFKSQVRYMDALVGRIIDTVEAQGLNEDTIKYISNIKRTKRIKLAIKDKLAGH